MQQVEAGNYEEAERFLKESAKQNIAETAETFYQLGKIKKLQLSYQEALDYFNLAIKINGGNDNYLIEAADIAGVLGYYDDKIVAFEKLLAKKI